MKKGIRLLAVFAALLLLGGCAVPLYEMTQEEEELVVQGAAYILSRYNIYQKDGRNGAPPPEPESEEPADPAPAGNDTGTDTEAGTDHAAGAPGRQDGGDRNVGEAQTVTLAEALGYAGELAVSYDGLSLMDVYQEGTYFSLMAESGKTFAVMKFTVSNLTGKEVTVDNFGKGHAFYCSFGEDGRVPEKESFLADSLSTYEGKIAAGESVKTVMIFEITKEQAELDSQPSLSMEQGGAVCSISL